jgi:hypothetical protein
LPLNISIRNEISQGRVQGQILSLVNEASEEILKDRLLSSYQEQTRFDSELKSLADDWIRRAYEIYRNSSTQPEHPDFKETVWTYGIDPFINPQQSRFGTKLGQLLSGGDKPLLRNLADLLGFAIDRRSVDKSTTESRIQWLREKLSRTWKINLVPYLGYSPEHMEAIRAMSAYEIEQGNIKIPLPEPKPPLAPASVQTHGDHSGPPIASEEISGVSANREISAKPIVPVRGPALHKTTAAKRPGPEASGRGFVGLPPSPREIPLEQKKRLAEIEAYRAKWQFTGMNPQERSAVEVARSYFQKIEAGPDKKSVRDWIGQNRTLIDADLGTLKLPPDSLLWPASVFGEVATVTADTRTTNKHLPVFYPITEDYRKIHFGGKEYEVSREKGAAIKFAHERLCRGQGICSADEINKATQRSSGAKMADLFRSNDPLRNLLIFRGDGFYQLAEHTGKPY